MLDMELDALMDKKLDHYEQKTLQTINRRNVFLSNRASRTQIDFSVDNQDQNETVELEI